MPYAATRTSLIAVTFSVTVLALTISVLANLQLFLDGSYYLFKIIQDKSAFDPHGRYANFVIQLPVVVLGRYFDTIEAQRLLFCATYAFIPLLSMALCWLVVRNRRPGLIVWPALVVFMINTVNWSSVSEFLTALQLSLPLFLAAILIPGSALYWLLMALLLPMIFLLHPMGSVILLIMAVCSGYYLYRTRQLLTGPFIFLFLALLKAVSLTIFGVSDYEGKYLSTGKAYEYFFEVSFESFLVLLISLIVAVFSLGKIEDLLFRLNKERTYLIDGIILILFIGIAAIVARLIVIYGLGYEFFPQYLMRLRFVLPVVMVFFLIIWYFTTKTIGSWFLITQQRNMDSPMPRLVNLLQIILVGCAAIFLISQFIYHGIQAKTGVAFLTSILIIILATFDALSPPKPAEQKWRLSLTVVLALFFCVAVIAKSFIWYTFTEKLRISLAATNEPCVEFTDPDFVWTQDFPGRSIINWALPLLALLVQDTAPRKLLLDTGKCQILNDSRGVTLTRWSIINIDDLDPLLK